MRSNPFRTDDEIAQNLRLYSTHHAAGSPVRRWTASSPIMSAAPPKSKPRAAALGNKHRRA
jgi:hypothetical protein